MGKISSFILAGVMLSTLSYVDADAAESAVIYGDTVKTDVSDETLIRLYIKNNPGIMGFRITFEYSSDELEILSADNGSADESGMFMDNIGVREDSFDLLWNSTENSYEDGSVAEILVKTLVSDPIEVKLSFSQEDTFDENFNDVVLKCENIVFGEETPSADAEPVHTEKTDYREELLKEIYALPTEQSPGEFIEEFLEKRGETEVNSENINELQKEFEAEGLSGDFSENISEEELTDIYNKVLNDYSGRKNIGQKGTKSGYNLPYLLIIALPIAVILCGCVIIIIHRRMKAIEKQK